MITLPDGRMVRSDNLREVSHHGRPLPKDERQALLRSALTVVPQIAEAKRSLGRAIDLDR